ncbi:MAG: TonB-dependent receptor plug domain-containing protein, partial [Gammaproteobacteria bacterium]|nr:TonB-dependent receptor plug domain-containing protein [Gammaproteobacteria bacterium]
MKKTRQAFLVALATSLTLPTFAEEQSPIIVTATRTAQTADESLASVTVITKEQIEQQQANDLFDVLANIAGIDMVNSGGIGKSTSLYMRGTNTGHVLVMIDGVQVGSATTGQAAYQDIPVELIERIEVVRGARASLYGSEAIGGVIQIFTRKPTHTTSLNFSSLIASHNTKKNVAGISGKLNKTSYSLQASTLSSDGFNIKDDKNPDNDGYKQNSANIFITHEFNNTDNLELS